MKHASGSLIVLTGPSGVGKGALRKRLLARMPWLKDSISATTRPMRPGEIEGQDYFFVTREHFDAMIATEELVEWAEFAGNYYGTPQQYLKDNMAQGGSLILEIEVQGALNIQKRFPKESHLIFIAPPSMAELEARLRNRNTNDEEDIQNRLQWAVKELAQQDQFDHILINDDLDLAEAQLFELVEALAQPKATP